MTDATAAAPPRDLPDRALIAFLLMTFAITWGITGFWIFMPGPATALLGQLSGHHPAFFLATWAPAIAGLALVAWHGGVAGLRAFLSRLLLWRCPPGWAAFLILGIPGVFIAGSLIGGGPILAPLPPEGLAPVLAAMATMLFLGPVEELGWRGVMQPLLQRRLAPALAGLAIGVTWGVWHLPAFWLAGLVQSGWAFWPFFLGNVALALLVTPLFNASRGSILLPMLFHWQLINPFWPDARPWDTVLFGLAALGALALARRAAFARGGGVTRVIPDRR
jgi:membrane protease YdiL (CAAX protease family)